ncbi:hypothetical protein [Sulfurimonas sp.]
MKSVIKLMVISTLFIANLTAKENNSSKDAIQKEIEKEKKFAKEQKFYQGKEYDLKSEEIDPSIIDSIPSIEPENDFDMSTGVYSD